MYLMDVFRIVQPNAKEYKFYSASHRSISTISNILWHKTNLSRFGTIGITSWYILFDHYNIET